MLASTWVGSLQLDKDTKSPYRVLDSSSLQQFVRRAFFLILLTFSSPQDFLLMFLHHVATISLITFSYVNNMARVGTLVMCLHDAADVLIEVGAWWWSAEAYFHLTTVQHTMIVIHLGSNWSAASELVLLSDVSQAAVFIIVCFVFLPRLPRWPITPNVRCCATSCLQCLQFSS